MKNVRSLAATCIGLLLCSCAIATATPLAKYFDFDAAPTGVVFYSTGSVGTNNFSITNGGLEQMTYDTSGSAGWAYPNASVIGGDLEMQDATILIASIDVERVQGSGGIYFQAFDGAYRYSAFLTPTGVDFPTPTGNTNVLLNVLGPHAYRLESPGSSSEVRFYQDGSLRYVGQAPVYTSANGFDFGDGVTVGPNGGDATWDYVGFFQMPRLSVRLAGLGSSADVRVSWPRAFEGLVLQQSSSVGPPNVWTDVDSGLVSSDPDEFFLTEQPTISQKLYRLRTP